MKNGYKITLMLAAAGVVVLLSSFVCEAKAGGKYRSNVAPAGAGRAVMHEKMTARIMEQLAETDPQRAEELEQLRQEKPEEFQRVIREIARNEFRDRGGMHQGAGPNRPGMPGMPGGRGMGGMSGMSGMPEMPGMPRRPRSSRGRSRGPEHQDYIKWLEKNYPQQAEELNKLKDDKPGLYQKKLDVGMRRYGRIMEASKSDPALAEVIKQDLELKDKRNKLLKELKATTDEKEKDKLTAELKDIVSNRFELVVKKKQLRYEELQRKLETMKKEVSQGEAELTKLKAGKAEHIEQRMKKLISGAEQIDWD